MFVLVFVLVAVIGVAALLRGGSSNRFCKAFGIPARWADRDSLNAHLEKAQVLRVLMALVGLAIGFVVASKAPAANGVMAAECNSENQRNPFLSNQQQRNILVAREISKAPNWVSAERLRDNGFTWRCPDGVESFRTAATSVADRRRARQSVFAPMGFLGGYLVATWISERRPKMLGVSSDHTLADSNSTWMPTPGSRFGSFLTPAAVILALAAALIFPMRAFGKAATPIGFVALIVGVVAAAVITMAVVRALQSRSIDARPGPMTTASLDHRRLIDYWPKTIRVLVIVWVAVLGLVLVASFATDLAYSSLWISGWYEPAILVGLFCFLTAAAVVVASRIVSAPKPFGPDQSAAAVIDDARRVEVVQRLTMVVVGVGLIALEPISALWRGFAHTAPLFGLRGFAVNVAVVRWLVGPYAPKLIVERWLRVVRSTRSRESIVIEPVVNAS
jgi:hypothetical protein